MSSDRAKYPQECSECGGHIDYGDTIANPSKSGKQTKQSHHYFKEECTGNINEKIYVHTEVHDVIYYDKTLDFLKKINKDWAIYGISEIAKVDVSSDIYGHRPVEKHALAWLLKKLESREIDIDIIEDISYHAKRDDIKSAAIMFLREF